MKVVTFSDSEFSEFEKVLAKLTEDGTEKLELEKELQKQKTISENLERSIEYWKSLYTLIDYHQAAAFSDYVKGQMDKNQSAVKFTMDTSYADRIYKIHRLIESLYPLAVAAALLLGGVLPGLIVLHSSKEISILRALGVRARDCVILYTLSQVLCFFIALLGL